MHTSLIKKIACLLLIAVVLLFGGSHNYRREKLSFFKNYLPYGEVPGVHCSSQDMYLAYCDNNLLVDDHLFYEKISGLGSFHYFIDSADDGSYFGKRTHTYHFIDKTGVEVSLSIHLPNVDSLQKYSYLPILKYQSVHDSHAGTSLPYSDDMRHLPAESALQNCIIHTDSKIWYTYIRGELSAVGWKYNDTLFSVSISEGIASYSALTSDTFIAKLLNTKTTEQAIAELMCACYPAQKYTGLERIVNPYGNPFAYEELEEFLTKTYRKAVDFFTPKS